MAQLFNLPKQIILSGGVVVPGARANFFLTGTTTPTNTYTTSALSVAHPNPVVADSAGVFPEIWLDPLINYKLTLNNSVDVLIYTVDPITEVYTQAQIGAILFRRTDAEISAGVTPANLAIPSHDVDGNVYPERYGAVGNDSTENATAFTNAIAVAAPNGIPIRLSDGIYRTSGQLLRSSSGIQAGLRIVGNGSRKTVIKSSITSASAVRLVKTDINNFDWGAELSGLTIRGNAGASARGLEIVGQWNMKLDDLVIEDFTSDGMWVPDRTDLAATSDPWSSQYLDARGLIIQNCTGWGINDVGQLALSGVFSNSAVNSNAGGGVKSGSAALTWINSSISYNGSGGTNGGLLIPLHGGNSPFNHRFVGVEFDSNYNYNQRIEAGARIVFEDCRDLSTEVAGPVQRPATQTRVAGSGGSCINNKFIRPSRRSTGTAALTWFDLGNTSNVGDVDIVDLQDIGNTSALTRIANQSASTVCHFNEYAGTVRRARMRHYRMKVFRSSNQSITTGTITKVQFDSIDAVPARYGQTAPDADFDTVTNFRWTAPFDGRVALRGYLTMAATWGGMGTVHAYVNDVQAAFARVSVQAADAQVNYPVMFDLDVSASDFIDLRVEQASGGNLNLIGGVAQGFWSIEYAASSI